MEGGTRRANLDLKPFTIRKVRLQSRHRQEAGWKYARAWMEARFALCRSPETHGSLVSSIFHALFPPPYEARAGLLRAVPCDSGKAPCRRGSHKDAALAG